MCFHSWFNCSEPEFDFSPPCVHCSMFALSALSNWQLFASVTSKEAGENGKMHRVARSSFILGFCFERIKTYWTVYGCMSHTPDLFVYSIAFCIIFDMHISKGSSECIGCPLLQVYVHCVCALGWVKCRAQIPSMGHHTWPHTTYI